MAALSAVVFSLSWWLGLYLLARDPRKPVLVLAAIGLTSFAAVVALDAVRVVSGLHDAQQHRDLSGRGAGHRLVRGAARAVPAVRHLAQQGGRDRAHRRAWPRWRSSARRWRATSTARCGMGHWVMFAVISLSSLGAMLRAVFGPWQPRPVVGYIVVATLFFALGNAILDHPARTRAQLACLGVHRDSTSCCSVSPSRCGMRSTKARRCVRDMLRSFVATGVVVVLFGGQALIGMALTGERTALTVLLFTSVAIAISINVLADPLAGAARPARVLPLARTARRPRDAAPHRGRAAAAVGQPARRASTTTPSPGSPVARSATTATCPSSSPVR